MPFGPSGLELHEFAHRRIKRPRDANEDIDADVGRSYLNLPEIGTADSRYEGKLPLRDALLGAQLADFGAQAFLFCTFFDRLLVKLSLFVHLCTCNHVSDSKSLN